MTGIEDQEIFRMQRLLTLIIPLALLSFVVSGCQQSGTTSTSAEPKSEMKPAVKEALSKAAALPPASDPHAGVQPPHPPIKKATETAIVVPEDVAGKWESVVLKIENKVDKAAAEQTIPLHSDYRISETNLTIKVGDFLPQFTMDEGMITSVSNNDVNPGVKVTILDGEQEIYSGWLFKRFPDMHPFQDPRVSVTLVGYNAKADGE
jgi:hypothetical protein